MFSAAGAPARDVGGLTEPLAHSRPSPSLREAPSPFCCGCRCSKGCAPGGRASCSDTQSVAARLTSEMPRPCPGSRHPAKGGQAGDLLTQGSGLTSQEGAVPGGCCLSTRCGRHTRAPSRASNSGQDTGLEPIGEETPVTSLGRQVPGGGSGPAVGHVPHLPPHKPLPGARKGTGFRIPGPATQPPSGTPAQSPGAPASNLVPPQGRLIQGILSQEREQEVGAGGAALCWVPARGPRGLGGPGARGCLPV